MSETSEPAASAGVDALRRVKATEQEWEQRLREAREGATASLERLRAETEAMVKAALAEAAARRTALVEAARDRAEREAKGIEAKGDADAAALEGSSATLPVPKRTAVLDAVLGRFRSG